MKSPLRMSQTALQRSYAAFVKKLLNAPGKVRHYITEFVTKLTESEGPIMQNGDMILPLD